ncbi:MAG: hypothetical protein WC717_03045, partial [Candidatus Micrarchaeia archaeon]
MDKNDNNAKTVQRSHHPLVAQPLREFEAPQDPQRFRPLFKTVALRFPLLKRQLVQAQMSYTPAGFVRSSFISAAYITALLLVLAWLLLRTGEGTPAMLLVLAPVIYALSFFYAMQVPLVKARQRAKKIEQ